MVVCCLNVVLAKRRQAIEFVQYPTFDAPTFASFNCVCSALQLLLAAFAAAMASLNSDSSLAARASAKDALLASDRAVSSASTQAS